MVKVGGIAGLEVFGLVVARFVPLLDDDDGDADTAAPTIASDNGLAATKTILYRNRCCQK